jgi:hypothetical protein
MSSPIWLISYSKRDWFPPMMSTYVWPFLIYAVILYVVSYIVVEYGQKYLYDEVTRGAPLKVALGTLILAGLMTKFRFNFATMFTSEIGWTILLAIVWVGSFILIYRFQPWHGLALAMSTLLIFAGLSTIVVDSLTAPKPAGRIDVDQPAQQIRRPTGGPMVPSTTPPTAPK